MHAGAVGEEAASAAAATSASVQDEKTLTNR